MNATLGGLPVRGSAFLKSAGDRLRLSDLAPTPTRRERGHEQRDNDRGWRMIRRERWAFGADASLMNFGQDLRRRRLKSSWSVV